VGGLAAEDFTKGQKPASVQNGDRGRRFDPTRVVSTEFCVLTQCNDNTIRIRVAMTLLATAAILSSVPTAASAQAPIRRGGYTYYYPSTTTNRSAPSGYRGGYYYYYPSTRSYGTAPASNRVSYYYPPATNATRPAATLAPATTAPAAAPAATAPAPAATTAAAAAPTPTGDPYGFTAWLNATRAQHGLPPVGYDPNLASWAAANNAQQNARGMGHHIMGPSRRQNCAMGHSGSIGSMWMNSPAHRANMLASDIRYIGIAGSGSYWTLNAY
jgi:uncharacterized protein YkwD